jgi:hypothetical protein
MKIAAVAAVHETWSHVITQQILYTLQVQNVMN